MVVHEEALATKLELGVCIQMVCLWVLVHVGPVNHPLQAYHNLIANETQLSQL
jgi:hypothetical protein